MSRGISSILVLFLLVAVFVGAAYYFRPDLFLRILRFHTDDGVIYDPTGIKNAADDATRKGNVKLLQQFVESYYIGEGTGQYPPSFDALSSEGYTARDRLPTDPVTQQPYRYTVGEGGKNYSICATLSSGQEYCVEGRVR